AERGAVGHDEHSVERTRRREALFDFANERVEERLIDRTARLRAGQAQRNRCPRTGSIHLLEESRQIRRRAARADARLLHDLVAADVGALREVGGGGYRREPVALDREAEDRDSWWRGGHGRQQAPGCLRWHATQCAGRTSCNCGVSTRQRASASGHRVWKWHPA